MTELSTRDAWRAVLGELQLQMPRPAFETWLSQTEGVSYDDHQFVVEAPTPFAVAWLERRMYQAIQRTVEKVVRRPLEVQFQVRGGEVISSALAANPANQLLEADAPSAIRASETQYDPPSFNPRYTFDSFVVGSCNELAFSTAQVVADSPGQTYNPLFLYSGVGLGKTHLLHAIGHTCASHGLSVRYVTSEQFTNEFISSITKRTTEEFRNKYRNLDVLIRIHLFDRHSVNRTIESGRCQHTMVSFTDKQPGWLVLCQSFIDEFAFLFEARLNYAYNNV